MYSERMRRAGLTMIELLIVIALLAILIITVTFAAPQYLTRAHDAQRKSDLQTYRTALEDYYTDKGTYPPAEVLQDCGGDDLSPYLPKVLCDPAENTPYLYVPSPDLLDYVLYAQLINNDDPLVVQYGCQDGCGPDHDSDGEGDFSIGITNGKPISNPTYSSTPPPTQGPTPVPTPKPPSGCGNWCYPNQCTTCCGAFYRCSSDGTTCLPDNSCDPCPDGVCTGGDNGGNQD